MGIKVGFAICASYCTFETVFKQMEVLKQKDYDIYPIMSFAAYQVDTRFGLASEHKSKIEDICGREIMGTIKDVEPVGPKKLIDILLIAPCTGNTLGKLAGGIADTPVTMACKSHLRNQKPVLIGVSTNDGLSTSAKNIGLLLNQKNIFFIPMSQDDPVNKPLSIIADFDKTELAIKEALKYRQLQPVYV